jgi:hypothetical protein
MHKPQATLRTGRHMPRSTRRGPGPPRARSAATPLKTTESRVTALGDAIREHPGYSPILLPETPNGIGTAAVTLAAGTGPFCRLRVRDHRTRGSSPRRCHDGVAACRACSAGTSRLGQRLADRLTAARFRRQCPALVKQAGLGPAISTAMRTKLAQLGAPPARRARGRPGETR